MARVTVEDCLDKVESWFELVMLAAQRSREINSGAPITVERDGDKPTVIALREIAAETIKPDNLRASLVRSLQKVVENEELDTHSDGLKTAYRDEYTPEIDQSFKKPEDNFAEMAMQFEDEVFTSES